MELQISDKCIGCGVCAAECPAAIISMEKGKPVLCAKSCIECGHCEAFCPTNALYNDALSHENIQEITKMPVVDAATAEIFLRSRRSIRSFKQEMVSECETEKLLGMGSYAPTGSNSQGVSYLVVSSKEKMDTLRGMLLEVFKNKPEPLYQKMYEKFRHADRDFLFRGAPMLILALTSKERTANAKFALTYIELFAPILNLGTCWAGYLEMLTTQNTPEVRELLEVPENLVIAGALLYGYPQQKSRRTVGRNAAVIGWR